MQKDKPDKFEDSPHSIQNYIAALWQSCLHYGWMAVLLFASHIIFTLTHSYRYYHFLDIPLHLFGGIAFAMLISGGLITLSEHKLMQKPEPLLMAILVFSLTCTAAIFWEFSEWIMDHTISSNCQQGRDDTMRDLFLGTLGSAIYVITKLTLNWRNNNEPKASTDIQSS